MHVPRISLLAYSFLIVGGLLLFVFCCQSRTIYAQESRSAEKVAASAISGESREVEAGIFRKRSAGYEFRRIITVPAAPAPASVKSLRSKTRVQGPRQIDVIRRRAESLARLGLPYRFGGNSPSDGGMDCSGSIQCLLSPLGYPGIPRTSFGQFDWMKTNSRIHRSKTIDGAKLRPGDLIFWGGTYRSGHKVSHVMFYMGQGTDGKLYMFGARNSRLSGVSGAGVDIHELRPGHHKNLVGYGRLPDPVR